ncbi:hypothetical protein M0R36_09930 [bacterium]|nr:hypothetical protein [bacterium]
MNVKIDEYEKIIKILNEKIEYKNNLKNIIKYLKNGIQISHGIKEFKIIYSLGTNDHSFTIKTEKERKGVLNNLKNIYTEEFKDEILSIKSLMREVNKMKEKDYDVLHPED